MRLPLLVMLLGCAGLLPDGKEEEDSGETSAGPDAVDLLLVVDNSDSMRPVSAALALSAEDLVAELDAAGLDWRISVTTTSAETDAGATSGTDPGEAGSLTLDSGSTAVEIEAGVLCSAICWDDNDVPTGWDGECTETPEVGDAGITREYLDCLCGAGAWEDHCGSGSEMPIESTYLAECRALDDPPGDCFVYDGGSTPLTAADIGSNVLVRDGATLHVLVLTDEGDDSYRLLMGDTDVASYLDLFAATGIAQTFSVVGPAYADGEMECNSGGAVPPAVERLQDLVDAKRGIYADIESPNADGDCEYTSMPWGDWVSLMSG